MPRWTKAARREHVKKAKIGLFYCNFCQKYLPKSFFYKKKENPFGVSPRCKKCIPLKRDEQTLERNKQAQKSLFFCNKCRKYLPKQFFSPNLLGLYGLRNECKLCIHPPIKGIDRFFVETPNRRDIVYLSLLENKTKSEIILELIAKGLEQCHA